MLSIPLVDGLASIRAPVIRRSFSAGPDCSRSLIVLPITAAITGSRLFPAERRASHVLGPVPGHGDDAVFPLDRVHIRSRPQPAPFRRPIVAAVLSVVVLKERLTSRKALSLTLGFVGSIVILRPGGSMDRAFCWRWVRHFLCVLSDRHPARREDSDPVKTLAFQCLGDGSSVAASRCVLVPPARSSALVRRLGFLLCHQPPAFNRRFPSCRCIDARAARLSGADWSRSGRLCCVRSVPGMPTIVGPDSYRGRSDRARPQDGRIVD